MKELGWERLNQLREPMITNLLIMRSLRLRLSARLDRRIGDRVGTSGLGTSRSGPGRDSLPEKGGGRGRRRYARRESMTFYFKVRASQGVRPALKHSTMAASPYPRLHKEGDYFTAPPPECVRKCIVRRCQQMLWRMG